MFSCITVLAIYASEMNKFFIRILSIPKLPFEWNVLLKFYLIQEFWKYQINNTASLILEKNPQSILM